MTNLAREIEHYDRIDPYLHQLDFLVEAAKRFHKHYLATGDTRALAARNRLMWNAHQVKRDRLLRGIEP